MTEKVMVLELKEDYALAMTEDGAVLRIKKKEGMSVGDQIYTMPEDHQEENRQTATKQGKHWGRRIAAMAAVLVLICTLVLPRMTTKAYAVVSFDGQQGLQVQVDANNQILKASSADGSVSAEQLKSLKGKNVLELESELEMLLGTGPLLVAYAPCGEALDEAFEQSLRMAYGQNGLGCLPGKLEDLTAAQEKAVSLGRYLASLKLTESQMDQMELLYGIDADDLQEDVREGKIPDLEDLGLTALTAMAEKDPSLMQDPMFRAAMQEALADQLDDKYDAMEDALEAKYDKYDDLDDKYEDKYDAIEDALEAKYDKYDDLDDKYDDLDDEYDD